MSKTFLQNTLTNDKWLQWAAVWDLSCSAPCSAPSYPPLSNWRAGLWSSGDLPKGNAVHFHPQTLLSLFSLGFSLSPSLPPSLWWWNEVYTNMQTNSLSDTRSHTKHATDMFLELYYMNWHTTTGSWIVTLTYLSQASHARRISLIKVSLIVL